jgi:hypothetical protein
MLQISETINSSQSVIIEVFCNLIWDNTLFIFCVCVFAVYKILVIFSADLYRRLYICVYRYNEFSSTQAFLCDDGKQ